MRVTFQPFDQRRDLYNIERKVDGERGEDMVEEDRDREAMLETLVSDMTGRTLRAALSNLRFACVFAPAASTWPSSIVDQGARASDDRAASSPFPELFKALAERSNVEGFRAMMEDQPGRFTFQHLAGASNKFVITLFRRNVLTVEVHGSGAMRGAINRTHQQGVVEFLHKRGVPVPFDVVCTSCGVRTAIMLEPHKALAYRTPEGRRSLLDNYVLLQRWGDREALREDVDHLLAHGHRFTAAIATPEYLESVEAIALVADKITPENYEDGDKLVQHMTLCAHIIQYRNELKELLPLIQPSSLPEPMRFALGM